MDNITYNMPVSVIRSSGVINENELLTEKTKAVPFTAEHAACFEGKGSYVLLDFGYEMCGGVRIITDCIEKTNAYVRITFGESAGEAMSSIGYKNATNDHSPRDFTALLSSMSDLTFGETGYRFCRIENTEDKKLYIGNIFGKNILPAFSTAKIYTSDAELQKIIDTAAYTLKLNFRKGFIWDGIKRDRLIWSGDLNPEIISSMYLFGDTPNISASLDFLAESEQEWINNIPSYSAWWVINFCDYCSYFDKKDYFIKHYDYACSILKKLDSAVEQDGTMYMGDRGMSYFLDWPTFGTKDAKTGTACIIMLAADKFLKIRENENAINLKRKLKPYIYMMTRSKQARAFQILCGRVENADFLEKNMSESYSTFMACYILKASFMCGGKLYLDIIKEYYGAMLSIGATTFFEDFNIKWAENAQPLNEIPDGTKNDIHGDYGDFCYKGYRHSLCHGWSAGVISFIIEDVFGIKIENGCRKVTVNPAPDCPDYEITMPLKNGELHVICKNSIPEFTLKIDKSIK